MLPLRLSEKELVERETQERADMARKLDLTAPGGVTISDSGYYQNADGQYVDEKGKFVNEPVYAKDVQQRLEAERKAAQDAEALRAEQEASQRADAARRAAELAQAQADSAAAEAKATKATEKK